MSKAVEQLSLKWHKHFMARAALVASCSKDPSTQCGAVIIAGNKTPLSDGYNGFPRGMDDNPALYLDRAFKYKHILHAEDNAMINALRTGTLIHGSILYCTHPPCPACSGKFKQSGGEAIVYRSPDNAFKARWPMDETIDHCNRLSLSLYELGDTLKEVIGYEKGTV